jgi:hypothetical protein
MTPGPVKTQAVRKIKGITLTIREAVFYKKLENPFLKTGEIFVP